MKTENLVRYKVYGSDKRPTVYYITGYGGKLGMYAPHIYSFVLKGFRVVAFEYDKAILNAGEPKILLQILEELEKIIKEDKKSRRVAGVYGVSLGTFIGLNIMVAGRVKTGVFNCGGVNVARTIWDNKALEIEKANYQKNGYTLRDLQNAWAEVDITTDGRRFRGTKFLAMNSVSDERLSALRK